VWPNFNVADSLLVCGALALVALSLRKPSASR
jgi:lipoprotein signal peptidase